jgi:ribosomal protein L11 methyltransferase
VLAIAAAALGWAPVLALDYDPASVDAARANALANEVKIEVGRHDLRTDPTPPAGTVAANLLGPLLIEWAGLLGRAAPGAGKTASALPQRLIASGLLTTESDRVAVAFAPLGLEVAERRTNGEWAALLLRHTAL